MSWVGGLDCCHHHSTKHILINKMLLGGDSDYDVKPVIQGSKMMHLIEQRHMSQKLHDFETGKI